VPICKPVNIIQRIIFQDANKRSMWMKLIKSKASPATIKKSLRASPATLNKAKEPHRPHLNKAKVLIELNC